MLALIVSDHRRQSCCCPRAAAAAAKSRGGYRIDHAGQGRRQSPRLHGRDVRRQQNRPRRTERQGRAAELLGHVVPALPAGADARAEATSSTVSPAATSYSCPSRAAKRAKTVAAFREKTGYTFPMGLDPSQTVYDRYASNYIPRNFVIDARRQGRAGDGRVRRRRVRRNDQNHRKNTRITMDTKTILNDASGRMQKAIDHLEEELLNVRAGKASPNALNGVMVDYFGSQVPVSGAASVTVPDAKTILIQPWDKNMLARDRKSHHRLEHRPDPLEQRRADPPDDSAPDRRAPQGAGEADPRRSRNGPHQPAQRPPRRGRGIQEGPEGGHARRRVEGRRNPVAETAGKIH